MFQQQDRQDLHNLKIDFFGRPFTSAQGVIGTEKCHDAGRLLNCDDADYNQVRAQIEEVFRGLTKIDILQPYIY